MLHSFPFSYQLSFGAASNLLHFYLIFIKPPENFDVASCNYYYLLYLTYVHYQEQKKTNLKKRNTIIIIATST